MTPGNTLAEKAANSKRRHAYYKKLLQAEALVRVLKQQADHHTYDPINVAVLRDVVADLPSLALDVVWEHLGGAVLIAPDGTVKTDVQLVTEMAVKSDPPPVPAVGSVELTFLRAGPRGSNRYSVHVGPGLTKIGEVQKRNGGHWQATGVDGIHIGGPFTQSRKAAGQDCLRALGRMKP